MIGGLKGQHQYIGAAVAGLGKGGFRAFDQPRVGRVQSGLGDLTHRRDGLFIVAETHRRGQPDGGAAV